MAAPSQFAQEPAKKGSGAGKIILIGCGIVFALGLLVAIAAGVGLYMFGDEISQGLDQVQQQVNEQTAAMDPQLDAQMEETIKGFMPLLSDGHSPKAKQSFENAMRKTLIDSRKQLGVITWTPVYTELMTSLSNIASDGKISAKESKAWAEEVDQKLAAAGYAP